MFCFDKDFLCMLRNSVWVVVCLSNWGFMVLIYVVKYLMMVFFKGMIFFLFFFLNIFINFIIKFMFLIFNWIILVICIFVVYKSFNIVWLWYLLFLVKLGVFSNVIILFILSIFGNFFLYLGVLIKIVGFLVVYFLCNVNWWKFFIVEINFVRDFEDCFIFIRCLRYFWIICLLIKLICEILLFLR